MRSAAEADINRLLGDAAPLFEGGIATALRELGRRTSLSKSQVSVMAAELVTQFRIRTLDAGPYTFVAADALTIKVREGGRVVKVAALVATGINVEGYRGDRPASRHRGVHCILARVLP